MTADRSYSDYEAIRNYQDRGMMKWGAFATGELTDVQMTERIGSLTTPLKQTQTQEEILQVLVFSWTNKEYIKITIFKDNNKSILSGQVQEFTDNNTLRLNLNLIHKITVLNLNEIIKVERNLNE